MRDLVLYNFVFSLLITDFGDDFNTLCSRLLKIKRIQNLKDWMKSNGKNSIFLTFLLFTGVHLYPVVKGKREVIPLYGIDPALILIYPAEAIVRSFCRGRYIQYLVSSYDHTSIGIGIDFDICPWSYVPVSEPLF